MPKIGPMTFRVLEAIADYIDEHGMPPTFHDVGEAVGLHSKSTIFHHVAVLRQAEYLVNHSRRSRALVPSREGYQLIGRDKHPPSELMPSPNEQPRMQTIPGYVADALSLLSDQVSSWMEQDKAIPDHLQAVGLWWAKIRRSSDAD